jgi:hypothetical protein
MTKLWQSCDRVVTELWQGCDRVVAGLWQGCDKVVTGLWQGCDIVVTKLLQSCYKGEAVTRISGYSYKRLLVYYTGGRLLV